MASPAPAIPKVKLSKIFESIEPEYVLGTTYTLSLSFFESVVLPHLCKDNLKRCLILCDSHGYEMAMSEAASLRYAARDYMVETAPAAGTFHAKVWLLVTKDEVLLLTGSGNLTPTGFMDNLELFDVVRLESGGAGRELIGDILVFLRGLRGLWPEAHGKSGLAARTLDEIRSAIARVEQSLLPSAEPAIRFLSSFAGPFLDQLAPLGADRVLIAAPYFGYSVKAVQEAQSRLGAKEMILFPAVHRDGKLDLPLDEARRLRGVKLQSLSVAAHSKRFAHLKVYGFRVPGGVNWIFTSSANCTVAALDGPNVEAGLLRPITASEFATYFAAVPLACDESGSHMSAKSAGPRWLVLWAADAGDRITLELAHTHADSAPLSEVTIQLSSGQRVETVRSATLFAGGVKDHVAWQQFGRFRNELTHAALVSISGMASDGRLVRGRCLVDDTASLTSDPMHRSALRAALEFLNSEAMPELGDISALFSLAEAVTDYATEDEETEAATAADRVAGGTRERVKEKAAAWPPTTILDSTLHGEGFNTRTGNIYWFNRILGVFLSRATSQQAMPSANATAADDGDSETANAGKTSVELTPEEQNDADRFARRLWKQATDALERTHSRLNRLQIDKVIADKLLGPATLVLISTLRIAKLIRGGDAVAAFLPSTASIVDGWLRMLLADRDQGEDFARTPACPYEGRYFPSILWDLHDRFEVAPHVEVLALLCTAFAYTWSTPELDKHRRLSLAHWLLLRDVTGDLWAEALSDKTHLEHLWQAYLRDEREPTTWDVVRQTLATLEAASWGDYQGVKDLACLRQIERARAVGRTNTLSEPLARRASLFCAGGFREQEVSRYAECCERPGCAKFMVENAAMQPLRELKPVVCPSCGCLLVPDLIAQVFRRISDGQTS